MPGLPHEGLIPASPLSSTVIMFPRRPQKRWAVAKSGWSHDPGRRRHAGLLAQPVGQGGAACVAAFRQFERGQPAPPASNRMDWPSTPDLTPRLLREDIDCAAEKTERDIAVSADHLVKLSMTSRPHRQRLLHKTGVARSTATRHLASDFGRAGRSKLND